MHHTTNLRTVVNWVSERRELVVVETEIDPIYEIAALEKATDNGPVVLFENIKGYPGVRHIANLFARKERMARLLDCQDYQELRARCREAINKPLAPKVVGEAPCQEMVITEDIDVLSTMPVLKYSELDAGRILSGGILLISGPYAAGGSELSFKRMHFRGKDWASIAANPLSHAGIIRYVGSRSERIPLTVNIGVPPAVALTAAGSFLRTIVPLGSDELGIAGALQGYPVEIVPAKTVDAFAIAQAEWVIEGYWLPEKIWESEGAEKLRQADIDPFFPEWTGYLGRSRQVYKFQATAITHRRDRPIFWAPLAHSYNHDHMINCFREACFLELAERMAPGLVVDVTIPIAFGSFGGVVFQVRKRRPLDEGLQRDLLLNALAASPGLPLAIVVDEDVNIHSSDDLLWALASRVDPDKDILRGPSGTKSFGMRPIEAGKGFVGGLMIDATVPYGEKERFRRAHYPVERADLGRWFSEEQIRAIKEQQCEYARFLSLTGA